MKIKYDGPYDVRVLAAADLAKAGVEGFRKTEFPKGKLIEVDDAVGKALIEGPIFGDFSPESADTELDLSAAMTEAAPTAGKPAKSAPTAK